MADEKVGGLPELPQGSTLRDSLERLEAIDKRFPNLKAHQRQAFFEMECIIIAQEIKLRSQE